MNVTKLLTRIFLLGAMCGASFAADASVVSLNGSGNLTIASSTSDSSIDADNALSGPGSYYYGNSYAAAGSSTFTDDFIITVGTGQLDAITSTINLLNGAAGGIGINDLSVSLFSFTPGPGIPIPNASAIGSSVNGTTRLLFANGSEAAYVNVLSDAALGSGTYVLQIDGTLLPGGGSYGGDITVSPVPIPSSWWLMCLGLVMMIATFVQNRSFKSGSATRYLRFNAARLAA